MTAPKYDELVKRLIGPQSAEVDYATRAEAAAAIRELVALRTVVQNAIDAGVVWRGEREREFQIPLHHYTAILVALESTP